MAVTSSAALGSAGERGSLGLFWGVNTSGAGLGRSFLSPHPDATLARARAMMDPSFGGLAPPEEKEEPPSHFVAKAGIDVATGKFTRPPAVSMRTMMKMKNPPPPSGAPDDEDPDSIIKSASSGDAISAALTAPSAPSEAYYQVLRALVATLRTELVPVGGRAPVFGVPAREDLGPAFPASVRAEDPEYFLEKAAGKETLVAEERAATKALGRAYLALGDEVVYPFDRKQLKPAYKPVPVAEARARSGPLPMLQSGPPSGGAQSMARLKKAGLPAELNQSSMRTAAGRNILDRQGRRDDNASPYYTVKEITGNEGAGTAWGPRVGFPRRTASLPLPADAQGEALRWSEQSAIAAEHRRARAEHALHLMSAEVSREADRQTRLRTAAAKFAASEARRTDPHGDWASYLVGIAEETDKGKPKKKALPRGQRGEGEAVMAKGVWAMEEADESPGKSLRFVSGKQGGRVGAALFTQADLANERYCVALDRAETCDTIMRVLEDYRLLPVSVAAGYLRSTLAEVDTLYAELIGARARAAGTELSAEEVAEHVRVMNQRVDEEEEEEERRGRGHGTSTGPAARAYATARVVLPSKTFIVEGGATPLEETADVRELELYGPSNARARRLAAAKMLGVERRKKAEEEAAFGPGRDATGGAVAKPKDRTIDDLGDPTLISGLSAFNLRPFNARGPVRDALAQFVPDPELDQNFAGASPRKAKSSAKGKAGSPSGGRRASARSMASRRTSKAPQPSTGAADERTGGESGDEQEEEDGGSIELGDAGAEDADAVKAASPPVKALTARQKAVAALAAAKAAGEPFNPSLITAQRIFGGDLNNAQFKEVALSLTAYQPRPEATRPQWQTQIMKSYDLSNMRESTGLKYDIVSRAPKEPPSGRYSHLLGSYLKADEYRDQMAASLHHKVKAGRPPLG